MNITVTVYLLVQAIVPSILRDLAKHIGRRPVYTAASIGLAFQRSYAALLILRMLQSAGSSAIVALAYAVISDIARPHEKGIYVGVSHIGFNTAPALGPVIGGLLASRVGWPWIFVFLSCLCGFVLILLAFFLPETAPNIVGDGSIPATALTAPSTPISATAAPKHTKNAPNSSCQASCPASASSSTRTHFPSSSPTQHST